MNSKIPARYCASSSERQKQFQEDVSVTVVHYYRKKGDEIIEETKDVPESFLRQVHVAGDTSLLPQATNNKKVKK